MANQATTTYKVTGTQKAVSNLWNTLQRMEVNSRNIWLDDLAKHYGIVCSLWIAIFFCGSIDLL